MTIQSKVKSIFNKLFPCKFHNDKCKNNLLGCKCGTFASVATVAGGLGLAGLTGGGIAAGLGAFGGGDNVQAPQFELPGFAQGIPQEQLGLIRGQVGRQVAEPGEFGISSQALQGILGMQPGQFQLPIQEIQQALQAQQGIEQQKWQQQMMPLWAGRGQLDSTTREQQLSDFLQGQSAQRYGSTADLLTQQALQNLQTQRWLPGMQAGVAGQLAGVGGQRAGLEQQNIMLPFQTTIPALGGVFGQGMQLGQAQFGGQMPQFQMDLARQQQEQQQQQQLMQGLGGLGMGALTGGIGGMAGLYGQGVGFGGGALQGLAGFSPTMSQWTQRFPWQKQQTQGGGTDIEDLLNLRY